MTNEIVKMEFMETPVDCVIKDGIKYLSITSISRSIGVDVDTIRKIISRNKENFEDCSTKDKVSGVDGRMRTQLCLSKEGIIGLMFMLNTDLYSVEKRKTITEFKQWAMQVLGEAYDRQFNNLIADTREEQRAISKDVQLTLMSSVKELNAPYYENGVVPRRKYMDENIMINQVSFGYHERGMRNKATKEELTRLCIAIGSDLAMHELKIVSIASRRDTIDNIIRKHYVPAREQELFEQQSNKLESFM